jgi:hypothetical protein
VADSLYGNSPDFLNAIDACVGVTAFVAIPAETRCWSQHPQTTEQTYRYKGEVREKQVVVAPVQAACSVGTLVLRFRISVLVLELDLLLKWEVC